MLLEATRVGVEVVILRVVSIPIPKIIKKAIKEAAKQIEVIVLNIKVVFAQSIDANVDFVEVQKKNSIVKEVKKTTLHENLEDELVHRVLQKIDSAIHLVDVDKDSKNDD